MTAEYHCDPKRIKISKPNGFHVLGTIFLASSIPRVFKIEMCEFDDFHISTGPKPIFGGDFTVIMLKLSIKTEKTHTNDLR